MKTSTHSHQKAKALVVIVTAVGLSLVLFESGCGHSDNAGELPGAATAPAPTNVEASVDLAPSQTNAIKIEPVATHLFSVQKTAVGSIDYDEDLSVQVFPPYQGKIITNLFNLGDDVQKGQPLYTIDSPDLVQAESTLISAAAANVLYSNELARATDLAGTNGVSQREKEQATSDAQTAEGALKAARDAVRVFGKTDAEMDQIIASRKIEPTLVVNSPVSGRITARFAQPGLLAQPGNAPAPYTVSELTNKWMVANVIESDSPSLQVGQPVEANLMAFPGRVFTGKISALGTAVDPNVHRVMLRCDIADPQNELRPNMMANFTIHVKDSIDSVAIPMNGVVRNGDATFAAWVTTDRHRFVQRLVKIGMTQDGEYQILDGLKAGELAVTDGAVFVSNILYAPPSD